MSGRTLTTDGVQVPRLLYGTAWKEDDTERLVLLALRQGFRGIDTANQRRHYHEAAVGGPPGDYTDGRAITRFAMADGWAPNPGATSWVATDGELMVWFGPDGAVTETEIEDVAYFRASFFARLRAWLGL